MYSDDLLCAICNKDTNEKKLVLLFADRKAPVLSLEKGEPREVYSIRAKTVCSSSA